MFNGNAPPVFRAIGSAAILLIVFVVFRVFLPRGRLFKSAQSLGHFWCHWGGTAFGLFHSALRAPLLLSLGGVA